MDYEDDLPLCSEMSANEIEEGKACTNQTRAVRYNDPVFERLFAQLWSDYQTAMNTEASLYGIKHV